MDTEEDRAAATTREIQDKSTELKSQQAKEKLEKSEERGGLRGLVDKLIGHE